MTRSFLGGALLAVVLVAASGCASTPRETYMVMPEEGGRVGVLTVTTLKDGREETLQGEYQAMTVSGSRREAFVATPEQSERLFGQAVSAMPKPPMQASLFFLSGKDELTAESKAAAEKIYSGFLERQSREVWIVGHTDTVGSDAYNEALSLRRAERVRQTLIRLGIPADNIVAKGRGKRELLVKTPDNTDEPRNRRVDISVR